MRRKLELASGVQADGQLDCLVQSAAKFCEKKENLQGGPLSQVTVGQKKNAIASEIRNCRQTGFEINVSPPRPRFLPVFSLRVSLLDTKVAARLRRTLSFLRRRRWKQGANSRGDARSVKNADASGIISARVNAPNNDARTSRLHHTRAACDRAGSDEYKCGRSLRERCQACSISRFECRPPGRENEDARICRDLA